MKHGTKKVNTTSASVISLLLTHMHGLRTPRESFFQKFEAFGLGQTNWAEIFWGIWGIFGQTISTILTLWVPCSWENISRPFFNKKLWFLCLKHITPKCFSYAIAILWWNDWEIYPNWSKVSISRIHLKDLPDTYKLLCFDRNINENNDVKFLECDYLSCVTVHETHFKKPLVPNQTTFCKAPTQCIFLTFNNQRIG